MPKKSLSALVLALFATVYSNGTRNSVLSDQQEVPLWPDVAPGSERFSAPETTLDKSKDPAFPDRAVWNISQPILKVSLPRHPNGASLIIVPGGNYERLALDKRSFCRWFNDLGITVFVLKYRLPEDGHNHPLDVPFQDAQRAVRLVRGKAAEWGLDPQRIGMLGLSAGGHLSAVIATRPAEAYASPVDEIDRLSARPDFLLLGYPPVPGVIPCDLSSDLSLAHQAIARYPISEMVTSETPPTFIYLAHDDAVLSPLQSITLYQALLKARVSTELHVFRAGGHGIALGGPAGAARQWPYLAREWMRGVGMIHSD